MSVVVAIKENNTVYIGSDMCSVMNESKYVYKNDLKIHKFPSGLIIGHVGAVRDFSVIKTMEDCFKGELTYTYVVRELLPTIIAELDKYQYIKRDGDYFDIMESRYLVAYNDSLFEIFRDGSVREIDDYVAIGSGESEAFGSLASTLKCDPEQRIELAIKASAYHDRNVSLPVVIMNTRDEKIVKICK